MPDNYVDINIKECAGIIRTKSFSTLATQLVPSLCSNLEQ